MFLIIAWHPATGKTTLSEKVKARFPDHTVLHTDDYMEHGYKESLYKLLEDIESYGYKNLIVEWVLGSRLMRKIHENWWHDNDVWLYLYLRGTPRLIEETYSRERPDKDMKTITATCKGLDTVNASIDRQKYVHNTVFLDFEIDDYMKLDLSKLNM